MNIRHVIVSLIFALFLTQGTAHGYQLTNKLESLVMPGPLSQPHAKFEGQCSKCHSPLDQAQQNSLCVDCHKNVGLDITGKMGFHGRNPIVSGTECKACHTDHEGRDGDIVGLIRETFNHNLTDFRLTGKHVATRCAQCHLPEKKFHEAKQDCISCHEKDDSHKGDMGRDCASCHISDLWQSVKFDHGKTKFPLKGEHEKLACNSCHPDTRYKQTPSDCVACHGGNDDHEGRFGDKCQSCHKEQDWKVTSFDHATDAKFQLMGKHQTIACEACHISLVPKQKISKKCNDCHVTIDIHKGRNGVECQTCHGQSNWTKTSFSHDKDTKFSLIGSHRNTTCLSCHRGPEKNDGRMVRSCVDCHSPDDVHQGQLGKECKTCHGEEKWTEQVIFDHDLTLFPLNGLHAITACDECHISPQYKDSKTACVSCHEEDDRHKQALGTNCATCHNPNGWDFWQFDHNQQADYKLDGAHTGLACAACHKNPVREKMQLADNCVDCHRSDDIHNGRFGKMCQRCHITETFKTVRIGR